MPRGCQAVSGVALLRPLFVVLLVVGVLFDLRQRRVPNWLVGGIALTGVIGALAGVAIAATWSASLFGGLVGLVLWLPFWMLGLLGAGDVKFFAAACCWIGASLGWRCALVAAVLGGVMSLSVLIVQRGVVPTFRFLGFTAAHLRDTVQAADVGAVASSARTFPYALPMGLALIGATLAPTWLQRGLMP